MSTKFKLLSWVALVGVGTVEIPFLLFWTRKGNNKDTIINQPQSDQASPSVPSQPTITGRGDQGSGSLAQKSVVRGNCNFIDTLQEMNDILWSSFYQQMDDYVTLSCNNTNKKPDEKLSGAWEGLFPRTILKNEWKFRQGSNFDISTETKLKSAGIYETIFGGSEFNNTPLTGTWGETPTTVKEKEIVTVSLPNNDKAIYLIFKKGFKLKD